MIGDPSVGKTTLLDKYCNNKPANIGPEHYKSTICADFMTKKLTVGSNPITLHIWYKFFHHFFFVFPTYYYKSFLRKY